MYIENEVAAYDESSDRALANKLFKLGIVEGPRHDVE